MTGIIILTIFGGIAVGVVVGIAAANTTGDVVVVGAGEVSGDFLKLHLGRVGEEFSGQRDRSYEHRLRSLAVVHVFHNVQVGHAQALHIARRLLAILWRAI